MEKTLLPMPYQFTRVEDGPVQFGDDWPGVHLRGDSALAYSMAIDEAADKLQAAGDDPLHIMQLRNLSSILKSCQAR